MSDTRQSGPGHSFITFLKLPEPVRVRGNSLPTHTDTNT